LSSKVSMRKQQAWRLPRSLWENNWHKDSQSSCGKVKKKRGSKMATRLQKQTARAP
jgi:hypothetical protein